MLDRILSVLIALSLALLVWLYAKSRDQEILDNVPIPVKLAVTASQSDNYSLELGGNSQVYVSFTGSPARIRELRGVLQRNELQVALPVTVPDDRLHESRFAETLRVESADIPTTPGIKAMVIEGRNRIPI